MANKRLQLVIHPDTLDILDRRKAEGYSYAETVRRAVKLFGYLEEVQDRHGGTFEVLDGDGKPLRSFRIIN